METRLSFLAWLALALQAIGCSSSGDMQNASITIGAAMDLTGSTATPSFVTSLNLAVADVNAAFAQSSSAKYKSLRIKLVVNDTASLTPQAQMAALALRGQDAKGIISQQAPTTQAINALNYDTDTTNDLNIPLVCPNCKQASIHSPTATDPDPALQNALRDPNHWWFSTEMNGNQDIDIRVLQIVGAMNKGDLNGDGHVKLEAYAVSASTADGFRKRVAADAKMLNAGAITEDTVRIDANANIATYDFAGDMQLLVDNLTGTSTTSDFYPDAIVVQAPQGFEAGIAKEAKTGGYTIPLILSANSRSALFIQTLADLAEGEQGTSPLLTADTPSGMAFLNEYTGANSIAPEIEDANCYDAVATLALAIVIAAEQNHVAMPSQVTGQEVRDAMARTSDKSAGTTLVGSGPSELAKAIDLIAAGMPIDYDGASGPVDFDMVGGVKGKVAWWKVMSQQFVEVGRFDCISNSTCPAQ